MSSKNLREIKVTEPNLNRVSQSMGLEIQVLRKAHSSILLKIINQSLILIRTFHKISFMILLLNKAKDIEELHMKSRDTTIAQLDNLAARLMALKVLSINTLNSSILDFNMFLRNKQPRNLSMKNVLSTQILNQK